MLLLFFIVSVAAAIQPLNNDNVNTLHPDWGTSDSPFLWVVSPASPLVDDEGLQDSLKLPSAREISNKVSKIEKLLYTNDGLSDFFADMTVTENRNISNPYYIKVPSGDQHFDPNSLDQAFIQFSKSTRRGRSDLGEGYVQTLNIATAVIDLSCIYGTTKEALDKMRLYTDGLLKSITTEFGEFPILNSQNLFDFPIGGGNRLPRITSLYVVLIREHNRKAKLIKERSVLLKDEEIFQGARRWVISVVQKITEEQYLPFLLGEKLPDYNGYNDNINTGIDMFFTNAAARYGHSTITFIMPRIDEEGNAIPEGHLLVRDSLFNVMPIVNSGVDSVLRGMVNQLKQKTDLGYVDDVRNLLPFNRPNGGYDLLAATIQRGREVGLPKYNQARSDLGLARANSFADVSKNIEVQTILKELYGNVNKMDAFVGGLAEKNAQGANVGPLFKESLKEQYIRTRNGDKYWYKNPGVLNDKDTNDLNAINLGTLVKLNTKIINYPDNPFFYQLLGAKTSTPPTSQNETSIYSLKVSDNFKFGYSIDKLNMTASFSVYSAAKGWFAFGQGLTMADLDLFVFRKDSLGKWTVTSSISTGYGLITDNQYPLLDLVDTTPTGETQYKTFTFSRKLVPDNPKQKEILDKEQHFSFAYSDSSYPSAHIFRKVVPLNLFSAVVVKLTPNAHALSSISTLAIIAHGLTMTFLVGILCPIGIMVARYYTDTANWLAYHQIIMGTIVSDVLLSAMHAISNTWDYPLPLHGKIGFTIMGLLILLSILGYISSKIPSKKMLQLFPWVRNFHKIGGLLVFLLGISNGVLGAIDLGRIIGIDYLPYLFVTLPILLSLVFIFYGEVVIPRRKTTSRENFNAKNKKNAISYLPEYTWQEVEAKVSKNNKWIVISGIVYDVTNYLDSHPGGRQIISQFLALDATDSFNLIDEKAKHSGKKSGSGHYHSRLARYVLDGLKIGSIIVKDAEEEIMELVDDLPPQEPKKLNKKPEMRKNSLILRTGSFNSPTQSQNQSPFTVQSRIIPSNMFGSELSVTTYNQRVPDKYYLLKIKSKQIESGKNAKHFVYRFILQLEENERFMVYPGRHVRFQMQKEDETLIRRRYTPIHFQNDGEMVLFIKIYPAGVMTGHLQNCKDIWVAFPEEKKCMHSEIINKKGVQGCWNKMGLIAGGTGLAGILPIIDYHLYQFTSFSDEDKNTFKITVLNCQHSPDDLFGEEIMNNITRESDGKVEFVNVFSNAPPNTTGIVGKLTADLITKHMPTPTDQSKHTAIFICGSPSFGRSLSELLESMKYPDAMIKNISI